jgi:5'-3' exonuclease
MPLKSFHLLPAEYRNIAENKKEYFPNDFEVDLNGKTLAWEAIVLIPFCDEESFLLEEQKMFEQGFTLNNLDKIRNVCVYELYSYNYNPV